jgi:phosphatidylserine/phosphatidylglycerophosphate/cardiolipin synthase-like enzyme
VSVNAAAGAQPLRRRRRWRPLLLILLAAYLASALWQAGKPLPAGLSAATPLRPVTDVAVLADLTWTDAAGVRRSEQAIFDETLRLVGQARRLVVLDQFLFNDFAGNAADGHRRLSGELTDALVRRRHERPDLRVVVITDPINTVYGGLASGHLQRLEQAGVEVVVTRLDRLPASNPAWSGLWHLCCAWAGNSDRRGWLPSPFGAGKVTLRSWLALLNFRANHRKTLVVDQGQDWVGLVGSGNPHDASSRHGNIAVRFTGAAALDLLATEQAVAAFSAAPLSGLPAPPPAGAGVAADGAALQILTEGRIGAALLAAVDAAGAGDAIAIDVFYLAHRPLLRRLLAAHRRGAGIRVLLDPNRDAFGRVKGGVPNRQAGTELAQAGIPVRWCDTRGEQCHSKMLLLERSDGRAELIAGSANFTRRNLDDLNLETSVRLLAGGDHPAMAQARALFDRRWHNTGGAAFSVDFDAYADHGLGNRLRYRIGEATGLSTW